MLYSLQQQLQLDTVDVNVDTNLGHDALAVGEPGVWFELGPYSTSCPAATCWWRGAQAIEGKQLIHYYIFQK